METPIVFGLLEALILVVDFPFFLFGGVTFTIFVFSNAPSSVPGRTLGRRQGDDPSPSAPKFLPGVEKEPLKTIFSLIARLDGVTTPVAY